MNPHGKVALITGASQGIGAALARILLERGARLALTARSAAQLEKVGGGKALVIPEDLLEPDAPRRIVARTLEHYGAIDILVNNAGVGLYQTTWNTAAVDVRKMFDLNVFAAVELVRQVVPGMLERRQGMIVNVASVAGQVPLPWFTLYSASKHAVCAFSDALRMELRGDGVHVMTVCPGYVKTAFQDHVLGGRPPECIRQARAFAVETDVCARAILRGIERNGRIVVTPRYSRLLTGLWRLAPWLLERRLSAMARDLRDAPPGKGPQ